MPARRVVKLLLAWFISSSWSFCSSRATESRQALANTSSLPITTAAGVRSLLPEVAQQKIPVRLEGVVTFIFNPRSCFVQDESAGIYVGNGVEVPPLSPGDIVRIEGVSGAGDYAPLIQPYQVERIGHTNLPVARRVSYADLMTGREDSQWVEVVGLVRAAHVAQTGLPTFDIDMGGGRVTVFLSNLARPDLNHLLDRTVLVRGVCGTWFNKQRQLFGVRLMVPRWEDITIEDAAAPDVLSQAAQPIGSLLRFSPQGPYGHRVKVAGVVVLQQPGRALFIQDDWHGLYVQTRQEGILEPGDRVEVSGFADKGDYTPVLQDASWVKIGTGPAPSPVAVRPDDALSGRLDSRLVTVEGRLLDQTHNHQETSLLLEVDGHVFSALLPWAKREAGFPTYENGSRLQLTGVCRIDVGDDWQASPDWRAKSFRLLLRGPEDVRVLTLPSWWSLRRLLWVVALLAGVVLASLLWAAVLRLRVKQQTHIIRQKLELEARLKERYRDLFESANDVVYTHDLGGRITSINLAGEQVLGLERSQVIGRLLPDFIAEEQRAAAQRWLEEIVDGVAPATVEWDFQTASGGRVRLETSTRLIDHEGGEVEVEGIARDVTERRRLEREILEVSTREQRRIGHDLHDGVCQQLAGIAMLSDILADKLQEQSRPEAEEAYKLTELVNLANRQTRGVARGLFPVRLEENGLVSALEELVENVNAFSQTRCEFVCDQPVAIREHSAAHHLYFVAQEAVLNAVKHGQAHLIEVKLEPAGEQSCILTVRDNGVGWRGALPPGPGMGIRIMEYRARMIGGTLSVRASPGQGVEVVCRLLRDTKTVPSVTSLPGRLASEKESPKLRA